MRALTKYGSVNSADKREENSQTRNLKIMKSQQISGPCGLGPRNYIWATWAQKTY